MLYFKNNKVNLLTITASGYLRPTWFSQNIINDVNNIIKKEKIQDDPEHLTSFTDVEFNSENFRKRFKIELNKAEHNIAKSKLFAVVCKRIISAIDKSKDAAKFILSEIPVNGSNYLLILIPLRLCWSYFPKENAQVILRSFLSYCPNKFIKNLLNESRDKQEYILNELKREGKILPKDIGNIKSTWNKILNSYKE